jgi:hypothetical protein
LNTGILCDALRAIDLDIDRPALAAEVGESTQRMLGPTLVRSRPNSGRCLLLYRAAHGCPGKIVIAGAMGKIEVLGRGQQFVALGIHPSGAPFRWSPIELDALTRDSLPAVSETQVAAFLSAASLLIGAQKPVRSRPRAESVRVGDARSLAGLVRLVAGAHEGDRNNLAFWAACRAGEMVAAGLLDAETAEAVIADAATRAGLSDAEAELTARSGVRTGFGARHA